MRKLRPADSSDPYLAHNLFTQASILHDSCSSATLEEVIQVATKICKETTAIELMEIEKDK